jgi:hypothetical protein
VVGLKSSVPQFKRNPPISVAAFMLVADTLDRFSLFEVFLGLTQAFQMVVIAASGDTRYDQKQR